MFDETIYTNDPMTNKEIKHHLVKISKLMEDSALADSKQKKGS